MDAHLMPQFLNRTLPQSPDVLEGKPRRRAGEGGHLSLDVSHVDQERTRLQSPPVIDEEWIHLIHATGM